MANIYEEYVSRINRVIDYIERNLGENLTISELADIANFSKDHFNRIFSSFVGETLYDFIQRLRIEAAASKLCANDEISVTDLAFTYGFESISGFSRAFKKYFDMSPTQWKEKNLKNSDFGQTNPVLGKNKDKYISYFRGVDNLSQLKRGSEMKNELNAKIAIKKMEEFTVAYVRHIGPYAANQALFEGLFAKLFQWAGPRGLVNTGNTKLIAIYHDNPDITDEDKLRLSVGLQVPADVKTEGEIGKMIIPGGEFAVFSFEINVTQYKQAWDFVFGEWLPQSGYQPADGVCYEQYMGEPRNHPEGKHVIDIYTPIKPL